MSKRRVGPNSYCRRQQWVDAKALIIKKPRSLWSSNWLNDDVSAAYWAVYHGNLEMLKFILEMINSLRSTPRERKLRLEQIFECMDDKGWAPVHVAAKSGLGFLKFLVKHSPSGPSILEARTFEGVTPLRISLARGNMEMTDYIVLNIPNAKSFFDTSDSRILRSWGWRGYFTRQKLQEIGYRRELNLLQVESRNFASLVVSIIRQDIETRLSRSEEIR